MSDDVPAIVPPICTITTAQVEMPSVELPPGEIAMSTPTPEQQSVVDHVFTDSHPAVMLLGVWTSAMILRDVAVDTFDTSGEHEEEEKEPDLDKDVDNVE